MMGKESCFLFCFVLLKRCFPLQHAYASQSGLSKDDQLRCKCSPEGGGTERSPVSFASEHKVCLW